METAAAIAELFAEHSQGMQPTESHVAQLVELLVPGEEVLFTCGWADLSEKWGPAAQLTITTRRIVDQRMSGEGMTAAPVREVALRDIVAVTDRQRGARVLFQTRALVVHLAGGRTLTWEHLTNHQVTPAAEAIERALDDHGG